MVGSVIVLMKLETFLKQTKLFLDDRSSKLKVWWKEQEYP